MDKEYISEVHDNYRKPAAISPEKGTYLFDFLDKEGQDLWRHKIYEMAVKDESDIVKKSTYKDLFCGTEKLWWEKVLS